MESEPGTNQHTGTALNQAKEARENGAVSRILFFTVEKERELTGQVRLGREFCVTEVVRGRGPWKVEGRRDFAKSRAIPRLPRNSTQRPRIAKTSMITGPKNNMWSFCG